MTVIAVLTTGRQDWGILRSTALAIREHERLSLRLIVGGTHLSTLHGSTVEDVRADGFEPDSALFDAARDTSTATTSMAASDQAASMVDRLGAALRADRPDALLLVGDRFETAAAALAATIERVPIIHVHGGEQTLGAIDDALRHAITKLSHLHLVSHVEHARRVVAMGEDPGIVHVVGAPGLDGAARDDLSTRDELASELGLALDAPLVIVTVHPATLEPDPVAAARAVAAAMDAVPATYVVTLPNADPDADAVRAVMIGAAGRPGRIHVDALGARRYWSLMRIADAMLGNSSSALIEAPAVDLPAVDVGDRQAGRRVGPNVIHAPPDPGPVAAALRTALDPSLRARLAAARPATLDGGAGRRIADIIAAWRPPNPPRKLPIRVPD